MRAFLLIITILFFQPSGFGQRGVVTDSSQIELRSFSARQLAVYKTDKEFQYDRIKEPPKSLWDRFWDWFWGKAEEILNSPGGNLWFKTIFILVSISVLIFFILKLTGMNKVGLFGRNAIKNLDYSVSEENIHSIDFEEAIQQAVLNGNLRMAVRLLYLQTLKKLTDHGDIIWLPNKTNITYVRELQGSTYQSAFSNLTLQFESNWYGDLPIEAAEFATVQEQFNQFNRQLL